jgi:acetoin utilization deacetylase AcuC-like enzyme
MRVFYSEKHAQHAPESYLADGSMRPCPDVPARAEKILAAVKHLPDVHVESPGAIDPRPAIRAVHAADYLEYLRTIHPIWAAEFTGDKGGRDVLPDTFPRRVGTRPPRKPSAQAGYYCFDTAAPITAGTWEAVFESTRSSVSAAEAILRGRSHAGAYALCRPPGHHAGADYCGGFCYLNNAAIAAQHLRLAGLPKVAVLDIDYHQGNGTQDIFYSRADVLFVSLHAEPDTQYPYFWGHADERGTGEGHGFTLNLPLARGTSEFTWLETLSIGLAEVAHYAPAALVVSLGVDAYEHDTVGDFGVSVEGFAHAGRRIGGMRLPTVFIQEGGYRLDAVGECVAATLRGFMQAHP